MSNTKTGPIAGDRVWLVKYALSGGAQEVTVKYVDRDGWLSLGGCFGYFKLGRDVCATWGEAVAVMDGMREKKIASLKKQLAKLEKMKW